MLTQRDLEEIEHLIEEKIRFLPTRDDFYTKMDEVMGELQAIREELTVGSGRLSQHSDQLEDHEIRITKLEPTPSR